MAKNSIRDYDATAANNTDVQSTDISEGCAASGINNAIREVMADLKDVSTGAVALETPSADQLNVDNIRIDGNTISSTDTNGDITLDPDGTGDLIVASGNVGIGTSSPATPLTVQSDSSTLSLRLLGRSSDDRSDLEFYENDGTTKIAAISAETDNIGIIASGVSSTLSMTANTSRFRNVSGTELMRIDSSGNVGIGVTPSGARLDINTSANEIGTDILCESASQTSDVFRISASRNTTDNTYFLMRASCNGVADRFQIRDSGNVKNVNNSYGAISDERMKENIVDANSQWADIKALQIRNYNMIGEDATQIGVIAQELEASGMSGLVEEGDFFHATANPNGEVRKSVKYSVLYMKAIGALQEAITKIETLETQRADLEARLTALENA